LHLLSANLDAAARNAVRGYEPVEFVGKRILASLASAGAREGVAALIQLIARSPEAALTGAFRPTATFTAAILTAVKRLKCANSGQSPPT
jgi:hypothetical protein